MQNAVTLNFVFVLGTA